MLVDTPGTNPFNYEEMSDLRRFIAVGNVDPVLVLPAGINAQNAADMAAAFSRLGCDILIATPLDGTRRLGAVLSAAQGRKFGFQRCLYLALHRPGPHALEPNVLGPRSAARSRGKPRVSQDRSKPSMNTSMPAIPKKRVAVHPASATAGRNVINIASGKGGVGKTWMAVTLAHSLARQDERTLLFDANFGLANVDVQLGLNAEQDLGGVVAGKIAMSRAVTNFADGGFDIIVGKSGSGQLADLGRARLSELKSELWQLAQRYDRVVIDLGAGLESAVRSLTPKGGMTLVVATDEPTSLTDAYAYIKVSMQENPRADMRLVINMATDSAPGRTYLWCIGQGLPDLPELHPAANGDRPAGRPHSRRHSPADGLSIAPPASRRGPGP